MKVLLADDDTVLIDLLRFTFERDGYGVVTAFDGLAALRAFKVESPDLLVLDLQMPRRGGMDVLREIRHHSVVPVIVLSVIVDEDSVVKALEIGADEYLMKPFRPRELRARARALLRRTRGWTWPQSNLDLNQMEPLAFGEIRLDPQTHKVTVAGQVARLTRTEFALLDHLMRNHDVVLSGRDILSHVWGYDAEEDEEVVRVTISRIRRKIEPDPSHPTYIINIPCVGYAFRAGR